MPIIPDQNLLFVHIPKNAGRAIESTLLPPRTFRRHASRSVLNRAAHLFQNLTANQIALRYLTGTVDASLAGQHLTLAEMESLGFVSKTMLETLRKFCVVRNPYDRAVSSVLHFESRCREHYQIGKDATPQQIERALEFWVEFEGSDHNRRAHRRPQFEYVRRGAVANAMDITLRFESLDADFASMCRDWGIAAPPLPWVGKSRLDAYARLYTERSKQLVRKAFGEDLEMFKYVFPRE